MLERFKSIDLFLRQGKPRALEVGDKLPAIHSYKGGIPGCILFCFKLRNNLHDRGVCLIGNETFVSAGEQKMLKWAVIFLIVALVAALLGFGGIAGAASGIALTLFYVFIAVTVVLFIISLFTGRSATRL